MFIFTAHFKRKNLHQLFNYNVFFVVVVVSLHSAFKIIRIICDNMIHMLNGFLNKLIFPFTRKDFLQCFHTLCLSLVRSPSRSLTRSSSFILPLCSALNFNFLLFIYFLPKFFSFYQLSSIWFLNSRKCVVVFSFCFLYINHFHLLITALYIALSIPSAYSIDFNCWFSCKWIVLFVFTFDVIFSSFFVCLYINEPYRAHAIGIA